MIQLTKQDVGKKFITREGEVVKMIEWRDSSLYPARMSNGQWYTKNGTFWAECTGNPRDIISVMLTTEQLQNEVDSRLSVLNDISRIQEQLKYNRLNPLTAKYLNEVLDVVERMKEVVEKEKDGYEAVLNQQRAEQQKEIQQMEALENRNVFHIPQPVLKDNERLSSNKAFIKFKQAALLNNIVDVINTSLCEILNQPLHARCAVANGLLYQHPDQLQSIVFYSTANIKPVVCKHDEHFILKFEHIPEKEC